MDTYHVASIKMLLYHKTLYNACHECYADQDESVSEKLAYCYIVSKNLKVKVKKKDAAIAEYSL